MGKTCLTDAESPQESANLEVIDPLIPKDFCELFRYLRDRLEISSYDFGKLVKYSQHAIVTNETQTRNPTIKTVLRYIQALRLEMTISVSGITIRDPQTDTLIVQDWPVIVA